MKTLRLLFCALFVVFTGVVFAACGKTEQPKNFDVNKIMLSSIDEFEYNGSSQVRKVSYPNVDIKVQYSFDKTNFKQLKDLQTINVDEYEVYYQISADGYNTYVSQNPMRFSITQRPYEVEIENYNYIKSSNSSLSVGYTTIGNIVPGDTLNLEFIYGNEDFNIQNVEYGDVYEIHCRISNPNYNLIYEKSTLTITDNFVVENEHGVKGYYSDIKNALNSAEYGDVLKLNSNYTILESDLASIH